MVDISVIVPVFNAQDYLQRTVESVIKQKFKNIEIILVNDGSTDNSLHILEELSYNYSNIKIYNQNNKGVSAARNLGLKKSTGKYIMFLDSDDFLADDSLKNMYDIITRNDYDLCFGLTKVINNKHNNNSTYKVDYNKKNGYITEKNNLNVIDDLFKEQSIFDLHSACAKLYKHDILKDIFFDEGRSSNEDRYFLFKVLCNCKKCVFLHDIVYLYEKHSNSLSNKKVDNRIFDNIYFSDKMVEYINNNIPKLNKEAKYNNVLTYMKVYRNIFRSDNNTIKNFEKELKIIKKYIQTNYKDVDLPKSKIIEIVIFYKFDFLYKFLLFLYDLRR